jgi:hypothetical protein
VLEYLGAVSADVGEEAMQAVDGLWWTSAARLPDPALVLRRNLDVGTALIPWLVPPERMGPKLTASCGARPEALPIANPERTADRSFSEQASLVIEVAELASQEPFRTLSARVTQRDFPAILEFARSQGRTEFGEFADRPE